MYNTKDHENMREAQKEVAIYLDSLCEQWKTGQSIRTEDYEGRWHELTPDFHLYFRDASVVLLTYEEEEFKWDMCKYYDNMVHCIMIVDTTLKDWQQRLRENLEEHQIMREAARLMRRK